MAIKSITYKVFAEWAIALANGEEIEGFDTELFVAKANKLLEREERKSEYSRSNKKPTVSKVSETTVANANAILTVLGTEPMTTAEINKALNALFEPLTVSNAVKYLERQGHTIVKSKKLEDVTKTKNGVSCTDQVPKTAYALAE